MTQRAPMTTLLLCLFVPFYMLYWMVQTKNEMNAKFNTGIPTAWIILIPFVGGLWFAWKYWSGVQKVTGMSAVLGIVLCVFYLWFVAAFMAQSKFNSTQTGGMQRAA